MDIDSTKISETEGALEPARGGRPSKLTPAVQDRIVAAIRAGHFRETAARLGGISAATLYRWLSADTEPYLSFQAAVEEAEAELEAVVLATITEQIPDDARLGLSFLSKRFPSRWGSGRSSVADERLVDSGLDAGLPQLNVLVVDQRHLDEAAERHLDEHRARLTADSRPDGDGDEEGSR